MSDPNNHLKASTFDPPSEMSTADKIKETVLSEATAVVHFVGDAVVSGTYIYPIKGITYYISNPPLWRPLLSHAPRMILLSISVIASMFVLTYIPQLAVLAFVDGPLAIFNTVLLVLSESSAIIMFIAQMWWLDDAVTEVFDAVLINKGMDGLVAQGREVHRASPGGEVMGRVGKKLKGIKGIKGFQEGMIKRIAWYIIMLPLNLVPLVGTVVFLILQGRRQGPASHARYFQLKNFSEADREAFVKKNKGAYVSFGTACMLLNMLPLANIAFLFTNTVGAALWAAELEKKEREGMKKQT